MPEDIKIDSDEFKAYYKAISKIDNELGKELRKRIMNMTKPVVEEVKRAALAIPAKEGVGETRHKKDGPTLGLRASLAASVKAEVNKTGRGAAVHIRISRSRFMAISGRPNKVAWYMEGRPKRPWRHPVWATKGATQGSWQGKWVTQQAHPFLSVTIYPHKEQFATEIVGALEAALNKLPKQ